SRRARGGEVVRRRRRRRRHQRQCHVQSADASHIRSRALTRGCPMRRVPIVIVAVWVAIAAPTVSLAQSHPEFIALGRVSAALYKPDTGPAPHVGFVIGHRTANYLNHIACRELSSRGFLALCFNTRFQNNETQVRWEETPLDVKAAVEFVRRQPA